MLSGKIRKLRALFLLTTALAFVAHAADSMAQSSWRFFGHDLGNSHHANTESKISPATVGDLQIKWVYETTGEFEPDIFGRINGDVTVPPAYVGGVLYFPDWAGNLHAVDAKTGETVWKKYMPLAYSQPGKFMFFSRNTPAVKGNRLILGSKKHLAIDTCPQNAPNCVPNDGAVVVAIDRQTGELLWSTLVDSHPASQVTGSAVIHGNTVIVPIASWEEELALSSSAQQYGGDPTEPYPCCTFRGSVVALDLRTGEVLWQRFMSPGNDVPEGILEPGEKGFFGVSVYSGSPSIDVSRGHVYVSTGNNYIVPSKAVQCELVRRGLATSGPELPAGVTCDTLNEYVGNYVDSMLALDLKSGEVKWSFGAREYDPWVHSCAYPDFYLSGFPPILAGNSQVPLEGQLSNCNFLAGPDFGFGQAPMILNGVKMHGKGKGKGKKSKGKKSKGISRRDLVGAGEKSGVFWMLDADTGELVWSSQVGPGGILGGMQWGSATDGEVIYTANTNANNASRDRNKPYYANPFVSPYAGFSGYPGYPTFGNDQPPCIPFGAPCEYSGVREAWTLVNPSSDIVPDGISTWFDGDSIRTSTGFWSALDATTGEILWQRPLPTGGRLPVDEFIEMDNQPGTIHTSVTLANGVVFSSGAYDGQGLMLALDAANGEILWSFNAQYAGKNGGSIEASPTVVNGKVYWGTGGSKGGVFSTPFLSQISGLPGLSVGGAELRGNKVYAFELPKDD